MAVSRIVKQLLFEPIGGITVASLAGRKDGDYSQLDRKDAMEIKSLCKCLRETCALTCLVKLPEAASRHRYPADTLNFPSFEQ